MRFVNSGRGGFCDRFVNGERGGELDFVVDLSMESTVIFGFVDGGRGGYYDGCQ